MHYLISIFLCICVCQGLDPQSVAEREWNSLDKSVAEQFSLAPPFVDGTLKPKNWDFGRDAFVEVNKYVRLTRDLQSQDGWLWNNHEIGLKDWALEFSFQVAHQGSLSGDGFAFWILDTPKVSGPVFGNADYFRGVGVFFDTYPNSRTRHTYPYIMAMIGDATVHYDHDFDGNSQDAGGCNVEFTNRNTPSISRVRYVLGTLFLDVLADDSASWTSCLNVSIEIPTNYYFGFSAMTGGVTSKHDITEVKGYSVKVDSGAKRAKPNKAPTSSPSSDKKAKPIPGSSSFQQKRSSGGGFFSMLFYLFLFVLVLFFAYAGYVYYRTQQKNSYKRF